MTQLPPEVKVDLSVDLKEPYPQFYGALHALMLGQIEYTNLRVMIIKITIGLAIAYIVLNILVCILSLILPLFGISILTWLLQQIPFSADGWQ